MRAFVASLLVLALAFLIGARTGCWVYLEVALGIAALAGLGMLIYPHMAPRPRATPSRWHRFHGWWVGNGNTRGHSGQVLMTLAVMAAIAMIIWGLIVLGPRIPSCAGIKPCGATAAAGAIGAAAPAVAPTQSPLATSQLAGTPPARDSILRITPEWSTPVTAVLGSCIEWQRQEPVAFEVRDQDGNSMIYPRPNDMPDGTNLEFKNRAGDIVRLVKVQGGQAAWPINFEAGSMRLVGGDTVGHFRIHRREKGGL